MNLQKKILVTLFALGTTIVGCDSLIYDDLKDCPQGVYVKFYSMTPCAQDSTFIGAVSDMHVFAFNENNTLVSTVSQKNAILSKDFNLLIPVSNGYYSFIGWAGVNTDLFSVNTFKVGVTTKKDVILTLRSQNKQAKALGNHIVWQGESPVVLLNDPANVGTEYKYTAVNLQEVTNRVNVTVELHESILKDSYPQDFEIKMMSANGIIHIDGSMPLKGEILNYPGTTSYTLNSTKSEFSLMSLKTGYSNRVIIKNKKKNEVIWEGDLIGSILMKNENVNLSCQHDFDVKFVIKDKCLDCGTYICWAIFVNNWQIHSYETELGNNH